MPALTGDEVIDEFRDRFVGDLWRDDQGCWRLGVSDEKDASGVIVFPPGTVASSDEARITTAEGVELRDGDRVAGAGRAVYDVDDLPPGGDAPWVEVVGRCVTETGTILAGQIRPEYAPTTEEAAELLATLTSTDFVTDWGCGYRFVTSTADELVSIRLEHGSRVVAPTPDPVTLPSTAWSATVIVGDGQFVNWCDDVTEFFEPSERYTAGQSFDATGGEFTVPDVGEQDCDRLVEINVDDLTIATPSGDVRLGPIRIGNGAFGCS